MISYKPRLLAELADSKVSGEGKPGRLSPRSRNVMRNVDLKVPFGVKDRCFSEVDPTSPALPPPPQTRIVEDNVYGSLP